MSTVRLGVDYGTSHCVAALRWPDGRVRPLLFDGSPLLDSAVALAPDGSLIVGRAARRSVRYAADRCEPHPKRRIDEGEVLLGGIAVPVAELIAATLREIWAEARRVAGDAPVETVLTCPASWAATRREILTRAAASAGMPAPVLLPEPVAAATHFAAHVPLSGDVVVYDLGAGTFDVTVLRAGPDGVVVRASDGLPDLGGLDVDALVVDLLGAGLSGAAGVDRLELWAAAREAKEALSRQSAAEVPVPGLGRPLFVTRDELDRAALPLVEQTAARTREVLDRAGVGRPDQVLLVGGATRMPLVATTLHRVFGVAPTVLDHPELVVAEGAVAAPIAAAPPAEPVDAAWPEPAAEPPAAPAAPAAPAPPVRPQWTRRRTALLAAGLAVVVLVAAGVGTALALRSDPPATVTAVTARAEPASYAGACPPTAGAVKFVGTIEVDGGPASVRYRWKRSLLEPTTVGEVRFDGSGQQSREVTLDWAPGEGLKAFRTLEIVDAAGTPVRESAPATFEVRCPPGMTAGTPSTPTGTCPIVTNGNSTVITSMAATIAATDGPAVVRYRWSLTPPGGAPTYTPEQETTITHIGPGETGVGLDPYAVRGTVDVRLELLAPVLATSPPFLAVCPP